MKILLPLLLFGAGMTRCPAQDHIAVTEEKVGQGLVFYIQNNWICPYTVEFDAELTNARPDRTLPIRLTVAAQSRVELLRLEPAPGGRWGYRYQYSYSLGDAIDATHDDDYLYQLPFEKGQMFLVGQGYHGAFSHRNEKAIDFVMPEGTPVCAAREGIVIKVKQDSNHGCPDPSCEAEGNYILIHHSDGSIANYAHLRFRGSAVKEGDLVKRGQVIAYSGNTGWSSAPHLHFTVYLPRLGNRPKSVATHFHTTASDKVLLEEKKYYSW